MKWFVRPDTFDGNGKLTARESHSFNGFIVPVANYIGTYTLKADCSGTMTTRRWPRKAWL